MTAEQSVRDRVAEVLAGHLPNMHDFACSCGLRLYASNPFPGLDLTAWREHQADAVAAAGLLAGDVT